MPEDLGSLTHKVVITQGFALFAYSVLGAVDEVLCFLIALGLEDAVEEDVFVVDTGRLVFVFGWTESLVDRFKEAPKPSVETFVPFLNGTDRLGHEIIYDNFGN